VWRPPHRPPPLRGGRLARSPSGGPKPSPAPLATGAELPTAVGARAPAARPGWRRGSPLRGRRARRATSGRVSTATTGASERGARPSSAGGPWRRQQPGAGRPPGRQREGETRRARSLAADPEEAGREGPPARSGRAGGQATGAARRRERSPGGAERRTRRTPKAAAARARRHASFLLGVGITEDVRALPEALGCASQVDPLDGGCHAPRPENMPTRPAGKGAR